MPTRNNKHGKNNGRAGLVANTPDKVYESKKAQFDRASEMAFTNIQWLGIDTEPLDDQVIAFQLNPQILILCITNLVEKETRNEGHKHTGFLWEVSTYAVNRKGNRILRSEEWNRRIAVYIKAITRGAMYGVNRGRPASFAMDKSIYKGYVVITTSDREVIAAVKQEIEDRVLAQVELKTEEEVGDKVSSSTDE